MDIKPGDTVRVISKKLIEHRFEIGDEVTVVFIDNCTFVYKVNQTVTLISVYVETGKNDYSVNVSSKNYSAIPLGDVELVTIKCSCDISLLMTSGCKCGAMQKERNEALAP